MVGFSGSPWFEFQFGPFLWTKELGTVSLDDFVKHQGTAMEQWYSLFAPWLRLGRRQPPSPVRDLASSGYGGWVLDMHKVFVCHATPGSKPQTISVAFPKAFDQHLADGDTPGRCSDAY